MAKKTMKKMLLAVRGKSGRRRTKNVVETVTHTSQTMVEVIASTPTHAVDVGIARADAAVGATIKGKKKTGGSRLWMRFDKFGQSELLDCDKSVIIKLAEIPTRDLRILGPVFSHSSNILAREKAMVVNLEFIKAIVTAEEVLLLDPLRQEVLPFVDQLKQHLSVKNQFILRRSGSINAQEIEMHMPHDEHWFGGQEAAEESKYSLPFEFQVLEIALEAVCSFLDSSVEDLERNAHPVLDELARNVSNKNLEHVRSLKSNLTRLLARVQKVRDEIEHLLDDNEDMAQLYLTRRTRVQTQQTDTPFAVLTLTDPLTGASSTHPRFGSNRSVSMATNNCYSSENDVEDLEMLLEAYFMQLDATRNKILSAMAASVGSSSSNILSYPGECSALPPKSPFLHNSPFIVEHNVAKSFVKSRDGYAHHQRNFSENLISEEQPSWLDDLLNEPDSPVHIGSHRRSSSDSFAYMNVPNYTNRGFSIYDESWKKSMSSDPKNSYWEFRNCNNMQQSSTQVVPRSFVNEHNKTHANGIPYIMDNIVRRASAPPGSAQEEESVPEKWMQASHEVDSTTTVRHSDADEDTKHSRQLLAQRSRVRKLQYIAELERVVQTLLVEGCDLSASLEFMNHQNIILNMENTTLKQRLDSLSHEQMIKYFEHDVLEKEMARLRATYHQQKLQQQQLVQRH